MKQNILLLVIIFLSSCMHNGYEARVQTERADSLQKLVNSLQRDLDIQHFYDSIYCETKIYKILNPKVEYDTAAVQLGRNNFENTALMDTAVLNKN